MRENTRIDFSIAASSARAAFLTYEPYYGLKEKPFSLSADPRFLYKSRAHAPSFDELRAGIRRREGLIVLTGEPGTGKTTLCRAVLEALDRKTFCTMVPDPFVSRDDLLKMLLLDFGVMSVEDLKSGRLNNATRPELSYPLYEFLKSLVPLQAYAVLIIDEAQNLSQQLLEEIRILSDLEAPEKLLQLVLVGQPELRAKLKDHSMRQLDQRVSVRVELTALDREGVGEYVAHRLDVAGGGSDRVTFSSDALDAIYRGTTGNPRLINLACDKSLHHGHLARTFIIGPDIVSKSLAELGIVAPAPAPSPAPAVATAPVVAPIPTPVVAAIPKPAVAPIPTPAVAPIPTPVVAPIPAAAVADTQTGSGADTHTGSGSTRSGGGSWSASGAFTRTRTCAAPAPPPHAGTRSATWTDIAAPVFSHSKVRPSGRAPRRFRPGRNVLRAPAAGRPPRARLARVRICL